jgi:hypothetical protein
MESTGKRKREREDGEGDESDKNETKNLIMATSPSDNSAMRHEPLLK